MKVTNEQMDYLQRSIAELKFHLEVLSWDADMWHSHVQESMYRQEYREARYDLEKLVSLGEMRERLLKLEETFPKVKITKGGKLNGKSKTASTAPSLN
tara:strand:+ start:204 stop:497 length:294 start_codon:yes stop_codon:yes gene_type:complete